MKRYIRSTTDAANANAKMIVDEVFGSRRGGAVRIYKQSKGYAIKFYADYPYGAKLMLAKMEEAAGKLNIPVIKAYTTEGWLQQGGSMHYYVACIVVPVA